MANPLALQSVLDRMADALPTHAASDTTSDISSSYELAALLAHAIMMSLGFRLLGFDEERKTEAEARSLAPRLPPSWNDRFGDIRLVYAHKQSSMTFIIRISRIGCKVETSATADGHDIFRRFEFLTRDLVNSSKLPLRITLNNEGTEDRSDLAQKIRATFVSDSVIEAFISKFKKEILQNLIPKLGWDGYVEETSPSPDDSNAEKQAQQDAQRTQRTERTQRTQRTATPDPNDALPRWGPPWPDYYPVPPHLYAPPGPPMPAGDFPPPGFEDEHEINGPLRPPRPSRPSGIPEQSPYNIGHDDLNPPGLGPHDPFRPSFIDGGGRPRPGRGGGMHPTFDEPLFRGPGSRSTGSDSRAPPGVRWDPVGPGEIPPLGIARGGPLDGPVRYGRGFTSEYPGGFEEDEM